MVGIMEMTMTIMMMRIGEVGPEQQALAEERVLAQEVGRGYSCKYTIQSQQAHMYSW